MESNVKTATKRGRGRPAKKQRPIENVDIFEEEDEDITATPPTAPTPIEPITLTEIFDAIVDTRNHNRAGRPSLSRVREELIERLKQHDTFVMRTCLMANFNTNIRFPFPNGAPPFAPNQKRVPVTDAMIMTMGRMINSAPGLVVAKERLFIQLLEGVNVADAQLLCKIKDRELEELYPTITRDVVAEVWPDIL